MTPPPTAASSSLMPPHPISVGTEEVPPDGSTTRVCEAVAVFDALSVTVRVIV